MNKRLIRLNIIAQSLAYNERLDNPVLSDSKFIVKYAKDSMGLTINAQELDAIISSAKEIIRNE